MKIKELIEVYEKLIPIYEIKKEIPTIGLCGNTYQLTHHNDLYNLFSPFGYYKNYICPRTACLIGPPSHTSKGRNFRIKFMKKEIIELNELLKQGYTDV